MNKARNRVSDIGGNAMRILEIDANRNEITVVAEALKCDFDKISENPPTQTELLADSLELTNVQMVNETIQRARVFTKR